MPGRHSSSAETTELIYIAEEAPRGKHTRSRGRRRRENPAGRAAKVAFAGVAAAAVAGSISYGAVSMVASTSDSSSPSALAAPARAGDDRASRSGGNCARTGPGQARVEQYLAGQTARFGPITMDASQDASDCAAIKKFQTAVGLTTVTGFADEATAQIADRLYQSAPASCGAEDDATTVCVDLSHQTLWVMKSGSVVFAPVVVRAQGTPTGESTITADFQQQFHLSLLDGDAAKVTDLAPTGAEVHVF
ncbi:L,D-transpeptidase [Cryptosporangium japonicum]|uniref:Peptidoglycan binding-like domain-containing protein n=1 Tax=Cryptosporangium japonicum TaxID=80872 RepID=A0ABN0V1L0_9ACTN